MALTGSTQGDDAAPATQRVVEVNDRTAFRALAPAWNALVTQTDDQFFYRHEFYRVWLDHFAPSARLRILTLRGPDGRLEAVLPLHERTTRMYGLPLREFSSIANVHSSRFDLLARYRCWGWREAKCWFRRTITGSKSRR
jgi:hypothetical protein